MAVRNIGIIVNGATGRIASTQHLANALLPIRAEGGLVVGDDRIVPRLLLAGRDEKRLAALARSNGIDRWTTDLDAALSDPGYSIFFDAAATVQRVPKLTKAIPAGKHIYSEKPVAPSVPEGMSLLAAARARNLRHGAVEDKIFLDGLQKHSHFAGQIFFGRVTGFRLDFGWWVFDGFERKSQRPSWNYQRSGAGGLTMDMYPHWRYVIESILGPVRRVVAATATAIPRRVDESGNRYDVDVDDTSLTLAELDNGAVGTIVCSWATRVRRDDLLTFQIDGTGGSAVAGLHRCCTRRKRYPRCSPYQSRGRHRFRLPPGLEGNSWAGRSYKSLPHRMGAISQARRHRRSFAERSVGRRARCEAGGGLLPQRGRGQMDYP